MGWPEMIDTKRKEEISKSYLNALCAVKGIGMDIKTHDDDGTDAMLYKVISRKSGGKIRAQIDIQLKSSSTSYTEHNGYFAYSLKKKNYDDLRMPSTNKSFLFLLILPTNESDWVTHTIKELVIKQCMYWIDLSGFPNSANSSKITVHLQKTNAVTSDVLEDFLYKVAEGVLR